VDETRRFLRAALEVEAEAGLPLLHETHRCGAARASAASSCLGRPHAGHRRRIFWNPFIFRDVLLGCDDLSRVKVSPCAPLECRMTLAAGECRPVALGCGVRARVRLPGPRANQRQRRRMVATSAFAGTALPTHTASNTDACRALACAHSRACRWRSTRTCCMRASPIEKAHKCLIPPMQPGQTKSLRTSGKRAAAAARLVILHV